MPIEMTGQNGAKLDQNVKILPTGCPKVKAAKLTRAQKLAKALKACRHKFGAHPPKKRHRREVCEKQARRKYGPAKKAKSKSTKKRAKTKR